MATPSSTVSLATGSSCSTNTTPSDDGCTGADGDGGCEAYEGKGTCCTIEYDRLYRVYRLDGEQDRIHRANHALFREHVGVHTDYDEHGNRPNGSAGALRPRAQWARFYEAEREEAEDCREEQVVGFTLRLFSVLRPGPRVA